jgi:hypothetical protein
VLVRWFWSFWIDSGDVSSALDGPRSRLEDAGAGSTEVNFLRGREELEQKCVLAFFFVGTDIRRN